MSFFSVCGRMLAIFALGVGLGGCSRWIDNSSEEKNPLISDARAKKAAYNFTGAVESLERALESNPDLALAHWELGLLYSQQIGDHAAAIYHFQKLLKLRPDWRQADTARQFINVCKIELAKTAPLGPQSAQVQQQMDRVTAKVHELTAEKIQLTAETNRLQKMIQGLQVIGQQLSAENAQLREQAQRTSALAQASAPETLLSSNLASIPLINPNVLQGAGTTGTTQFIPNRSQGAPNNPSRNTSGSPATGRLAGSSIPSSTTSAPPSRASPRELPTKAYYTIKPGDRLFVVARQQGTTVKELIRLNPGVDSGRVKPGQRIVVRGP